MEIKVLEWALANGGVLGLVLASLVLSAGLYFKHRGGVVDRSGVTNAGLSDQISAVASKVQAHDRRLVHLETEIGQLPTRQELHDVQVSIARLEVDVRSTKDTTRATNASVGRIENYLINQGGGAK